MAQPVNTQAKEKIVLDTNYTHKGEEDKQSSAWEIKFNASDKKDRNTLAQNSVFNKDFLMQNDKILSQENRIKGFKPIQGIMVDKSINNISNRSKISNLAQNLKPNNQNAPKTINTTKNTRGKSNILCLKQNQKVKIHQNMKMSTIKLDYSSPAKM